MRIDKALWCLRIFKTRKLAKEACDKNKVKVNSLDVKSATSVGAGDMIKVRKGAVYYTYQVIELPKSRVGASILFQFMNDMTPKAEIEKARQINIENKNYALNRGRPSKKDLRSIKNFFKENESSE